MLMQKEMENAMLHTNQNFMNNLEKSLDILTSELKQAKAMTYKCTDEWCTVTESFIDDMHKSLYSICEPSWFPKEESRRLKELRKKTHDLYREFAHIKDRHA